MHPHDTTKRCTACGVEKPFDQFHRDKSRRDGYRDRCKDCIRDYQRTWLPDYVARVQVQQADAPAVKRCTDCGEEKPLTEFHRTPNTVDGRRPICKLCACDYQHSHRRDPRYVEKVRAGDHHKYHSLPIDVKKRLNRHFHERHKKRYWSDPEYRRRERIRNTHKSNRRRVRKANNGGSHTAQEWLDLCAQFDHRCLCCGRRRPLTRDHIVPIEQGGTDDISNIQPLCRSCNSAKGTQTIDYRPYTEFG